MGIFAVKIILVLNGVLVPNYAKPFLDINTSVTATLITIYNPTVLLVKVKTPLPPMLSTAAVMN